MDIKRAVVTAIEATQDPLAAIKMNEAYNAVSAVCKTLTPMANQVMVNAITDRLLQGFTDEELDKANPDLIIALGGCFNEALTRLGAKFMHGEKS